MSYIDIQKTNSNLVIIYATSYFNPLGNLEQLSEELAASIKESCDILFDLLLSNGDSYNRFVTCKFDGGNIMRDSIDIISEDCIEPTYKKIISNYYRRLDKSRYMNSALSKYDIGKVMRKYQQQALN